MDNGPQKKQLNNKVTWMMKDFVFGYGTTTSMLGSPDHSRAAKWEEKAKVKEKAMVDSKENEEHSLVKSKHRTPNRGQKTMVLGGPKENEARKALRKAMNTFGKVVFVLTHQKMFKQWFQPAQRQRQGPKRKGQGRFLSSIWTFSLCKIQRRKTWQLLGISRSVIQLHWRFLLFDYCMVWHGAYCMDGISPFEPCLPSDARCSGSWLHTVNWIKSGNQKVPQVCVVLWHYDRILPLQ